MLKSQQPSKLYEGPNLGQVSTMIGGTPFMPTWMKGEILSMLTLLEYPVADKKKEQKPADIVWAAQASQADIGRACGDSGRTRTRRFPIYRKLGLFTMELAPDAAEHGYTVPHILRFHPKKLQELYGFRKDHHRTNHEGVRLIQRAAKRKGLFREAQGPQAAKTTRKFVVEDENGETVSVYAQAQNAQEVGESMAKVDERAAAVWAMARELVPANLLLRSGGTPTTVDQVVRYNMSYDDVDEIRRQFTAIGKALELVDQDETVSPGLAYSLKKKRKLWHWSTWNKQLTRAEVLADQLEYLQEEDGRVGFARLFQGAQYSEQALLDLAYYQGESLEGWFLTLGETSKDPVRLRAPSDEEAESFAERNHGWLQDVSVWITGPPSEPVS